MAFKISPSIDVSELDLTLGVAAVATSIAGFVGPFQWGPVLDIVTTSSEQEYASNFGKPNNDVAASWLCGANFLAYSNNLKVVRVAGDAAKNAVSDITEYYTGIVGTDLTVSTDISGVAASAIHVFKNSTELDQVVTPTTATEYSVDTVTGEITFGSALVATDKVVVYVESPAGVRVDNQNDYEAKYESALLPSTFVAKYPGSLGNGLVVELATPETYDNWRYKNAFDGAPVDTEMHMVVVDGDGVWSGTPGTILEKFAYVSTDPTRKNTDGSTAYIVDVVNRGSKYVLVGNSLNDADFEFNWSPVSKANQTSNTVTYADLADEDYITSTKATKRVEKYVRSGTPVASNLAITLVTTAGGLAGTTISVDSSVAGTLALTTDYTILGNVITILAGAIVGEEFTITIEDANIALTSTNYAGGPTITLQSAVGTATTNAAYIESYDVESALSNVYSTKLAGGVDDNTGVDLIDGYTLFQDAEDVDIQLFIAGVASQTEARYAVDNIGEGRKDCVVFVSPRREDVVNINNADTILDNLVGATGFYTPFNSSSYAFADSGWKYQYDKYNDVYRWVPLCGDMAGLAARTDSTNDPWWAFGGYNRGQVKNAVKLAWSPKKTYRDELFRNRVNPVITERGEGTVLLGDKTMLSRPSAFDAVNVRRLFITLEKAIATASKYLLFEFNDEFTQAQFRNLVEPFLRDVKGRRGIEDFRVVCDESNNTGEVKQRREFVGDIYIKPNYAIRYVQLNFIAVRSDVSFNEVGA